MMTFTNNLKKINYFNIACYCTNAETKLRYTSTVFLPKTKLPLLLTHKKIVDRDNYIYDVAGFENLYDWQRGNLSEPEFVLHDGPPYANGLPHMGHAINKILKDAILRCEILKGNKVHYIPGWDCHGLPIELKALSDSFNVDPIELRDKARLFAKRTTEDQKRVFKSWGVCGDWKNSYTTHSVDYVKTQLRQFLKLYKKNLIFRDVKPIYWSPSSRTALAEAELEYEERHKSLSAFVKLEIKNIPKLGSLDSKCYAVVWTTTPWTIPANQAVCFNTSMSYSIVKRSNGKEDFTYLAATELLKETIRTPYITLKEFPGSALEGTLYEHPIYKDQKPYSFLNSSHVSNSKGTGLVHLAGAHGQDDFLISLNNKLPIVDFVDDSGYFISTAGPKLEGKSVFNEGNKAVIDMLRESSNLLRAEKYIHSYPYDWRTKEPVIIKASKQWFIDTNAIKNRAIELLENVKILPSERSQIYKSNFVKQIQKRPYWCISRQRKWGVPIPIIYNKTSSETIINENTINHQINLLDTKGPDFWWKSNAQDLLPPNSYSSSDNLEKCEDIMDIWLDSGLSWAKVLEGTKVADIYLEGVDQFTGWFQSSLLTSVALRDKAPFKTIYVHGFAVDEEGIKMSKSLGNVVDPLKITGGLNGKGALGIDTLRWWVTCHANKDALASIGKGVLKSSLDEVQKIRSSLRFAISTLTDYDKSDIEKQDKSNLLLIDRYMLHLLYQFRTAASEHMQEYNFHKISALLNNLLTNSISALYYNSVKDRVYCDPLDSPGRRSAQFTLYHIFEAITQTVAPMLPHLVEELYLYYPLKDTKTYFTTSHPKLGEHWEDKEVASLFELLLSCKRDVNKGLGASTSHSVVNIAVSSEVCIKIKFFQEVKFLFFITDNTIPEVWHICDKKRELDFLEEQEIKKHLNNSQYNVLNEQINLGSFPLLKLFLKGPNPANTITYIRRTKYVCKKVTNLKELETQCADIFQVSQVNIIEDNAINEDYKIKLSKSLKYLCPRCRKTNSYKEDILCNRCDEVVASMSNKTAAVV